MKPLQLMPLFLIISSLSFGQNLTIKKVVDKMDDSEHFVTSKNLKLANPTKKYFTIEPIISKNDSNKLVCTGLYITYSGIGACNENDVMDFLFMDGKKLKIKALNEFHCNNTSAFFVDKTNNETLIDISELNKPVKSIR